MPANHSGQSSKVLSALDWSLAGALLLSCVVFVTGLWTGLMNKTKRKEKKGRIYLQSSRRSNNSTLTWATPGATQVVRLWNAREPHVVSCNNREGRCPEVARE